ncbi:helix-turn-helix domain-containing protein [Parvularcula sp. IMCC14364]|uniref:helix-turn-helix domain-containing protein n=1 Tax=Parvularcula sp. IMCC14364 TaxID=3067902 RepID=UPI0027409C77|nr:helix-turn-helix transcriptional regulator [Parvularcula sp. IMCC14364]
MKEYAVIFLGAWRAHKDLTVEELGRRAGLDAKNVTALEKSTSDYSPEDIARLSKALGIEPYKLFIHPAVQFDNKPSFDGVTADTMATLLQLYIPDAVSRLKDQEALERLFADDLPEDYWHVQGEKMIELLGFLRSCREDRPAALRALFSSLETDSLPPHNPD